MEKNSTAVMTTPAGNNGISNQDVGPRTGQSTLFEQAMSARWFHPHTRLYIHGFIDCCVCWTVSLCIKDSINFIRLLARLSMVPGNLLNLISYRAPLDAVDMETMLWFDWTTKLVRAELRPYMDNWRHTDLSIAPRCHILCHWDCHRQPHASYQAVEGPHRRRHGGPK